MKQVGSVVLLLACLVVTASGIGAEPRLAGSVVVNGKPTSASFYREDRHLYYPVIDIAIALGKRAEYDAAQRRLIVSDTQVADPVRLIEGRPFVAWRTLSRLFPGLVYGMRGDKVFFETRRTVSVPVSAPSSPPDAGRSGMSAVELRVVEELSLARTKPAQYATCLKELRGRFHGKNIEQPDGVLLTTREGLAAVDEAIGFLSAQAPLGALEPSEGLALGALDHVRDQGPRGVTGHDGSDGSRPASRVSRYGQWRAAMGENIAYGTDTPREIVMYLIIDDGVPDRGHRTNIFNPAFKCVGVAVGPHAHYRTMCVMEFAGGFIPGKYR